MRWVRGFLGLIMVVAIAAAALYLVRAPIASFAAERALANAGFENPDVAVADISRREIRIKRLAIGPKGRESIALGETRVGFDPARVLRERTVDEITIANASLRATLSEDGKVLIAGLPTGREAGGGAGAPFDRLILEDASIALVTPEGVVTGEARGTYDVKTGADGALSLLAEQAGARGFQISDAAANLKVSLKEDGAFTAAGHVAGDLATPAGNIRDIDAEMSVAGASWRRLSEPGSLEARAVIDLRSASAPVEAEGPLAAINSGAGLHLFARPVAQIDFAGGLDAALKEGAFSVSFREGEGDAAALVARTDTGAALTLNAKNNAPLYSTSDAQRRIAFTYNVTGAEITGAGAFDARREAGAWRFAAPAEIDDYASDVLAFSDASIGAEGTMQGGRVDANVSIQTTLARAVVGRLTVSDAPVDLHVTADLDMGARSLTIASAGEACPRFESARFAMKAPDIRASVRAASLCGADADTPLAVIDWSGASPKATVSTLLSAERATYRLGQTRFAGRPPTIDMVLDYEPAREVTTFSGAYKLGALIYNDFLAFSRMDGDFEGALEGDMLTVRSTLRRMRIVSTMETLLVAPVFAAGEGALRDREATFDFTLETRSGERLGEGDGVHDLDSAKGSADFRFERLEFAPLGLQPEALAPVLRGIIGETVGAVTGDAKFSWAPPPVGMASSGAFTFHDLTFQGPGITVNQTAGLSGDVAMASLWPPATDGTQEIAIGKVDLAALQLENGTVLFNMPGDDTFDVEQAIFPWFGGSIGVYGATAAMTGGEAMARLEARDVDLAKVLEFIDVDGLSGEGVLNGVLPLVVSEGKARIDGGRLSSAGAGAVRYVGAAGEAAAAAGDQADVAFSILRDLQFDVLAVEVDGPLDGDLQFKMIFEGRGDVPVSSQQGPVRLADDKVRVPVKYTINLEAALLELLNQAKLSQDVELQVERAISGGEDAN
ncbi:MAG: YdbH domain-containing protein [Pseudomonadota bacterium]